MHTLSVTAELHPGDTGSIDRCKLVVMVVVIIVRFFNILSGYNICVISLCFPVSYEDLPSEAMQKYRHVHACWYFKFDQELTKFNTHSKLLMI